MKPRAAAILLHALLIALAVGTAFPLLWMLSVSLMPAGEASAFPPPLLPSHATLANYRELFGREGIGR
ncbi:MAG: carbohydrate ABC transporter permease, partial [Gammaproteobacteria bacterium]